MVPATVTSTLASALEPKHEGRATFRALDPERDRAEIERLLARAVPHDYLLQMLDRWLGSPGTLGGFDGQELVAIEKLEDLEQGEGWLGAIRVAPERRREGWAHRLTAWSLEVAKRMGMQVVRLIIEDENTASRALSKGLGFRSVAALSHSVGIAPATVPSSGKVARLARDEELPDPRELEGLRRTNGFLLTTVPHPMRFVRATPLRLKDAARAGHLRVIGDDVREGLALLGPRAPWRFREGQTLRLLTPLGASALEIFETVSEGVREEGCELEGFLPDDPPFLPPLRSAGWKSGEHATWGEHVQLYEVAL
ncbi:MAG: GNAT family N-acetyltransferase [Euryarchaeota archaeon]|nr:GNAT family N-acetyltransferase [Euryarchaeota archaeon]MDE1837739.1 GNAT family N-acetyltransferase [Euryarchaeota archaeon]MDE1880935.1 GNAT family N-acetyltransferase [Euryarchaeota archaeon]MDE2046098.1 GNAT family N-acetyltransferase [Thermoplasmata archaeon]